MNDAAGTRPASAMAQVDAALARIAARDGDIRAFVRLAPDARERAAALDRENSRGPLHGLPVAIKDIIATKNLGTEYGSAIHAGHIPSEDADCVRRLKAAGAIIIGKTVSTEFAHLTPGPTRNPHDLSRTPGGSSSGSAAAVAAGMAPVALGTQTGGSVIRPASYCGAFGFKSSIGRTEMTGIHELARSFDSLGWIAASAADLMRVGRVLLTPARAWPDAPERPRLARLRAPWDGRGADYAHALADAFRARLATEGAIIEEVSLPAHFGDVEALHQGIVAVDASRAFAAYRGRLSPTLESFLERADEAAHAGALAQAKNLRREFDGLTEKFDALILPAATGEAPVGLGHTGDSIFSTPLSLIGPACATLPLGRGPNGLPVGVQMVARRGEDEGLLALAAWAAEKAEVTAMLAS